jgi:glycerol-3-phosphate dehydrogenase
MGPPGRGDGGDVGIGEGTADGIVSFDVAVIGAGVVGAAMARRFQLDGARVVVLEAAAEVLDGASKGNSGILHTGFDAPVGSLEARCIAAGRTEYLGIREELGLPLVETGALVLAWNAAEAALLPTLLAQAQANGVADAALLGPPEVYALEPGLGSGVTGGMVVPGEHVIDPWSAAHAYLLQALLNGAELRLAAAVTGARFDGSGWRLDTPAGEVSAGAVVACAGLEGDRVEALLLGEASFTIRPRKGQFIVYDKPAAALARHILLPVPSATTKGVVVCRTAWGNLLVGPTAEEQDSRSEAATDRATLEMLRRLGEQILPGLAGEEVTASYAGLRPATERKDYRLRADAARRVVSVGGIRSTGLSAALGLARHVAELARGFGMASTPLAEPVVPRLPSLAEAEPPAPGQGRDWTRAGHGGIVCHCELVTRREIEAALAGPLAARTLAGLKRRTRVTMGRCQGFNCLAELARITHGRLATPVGVPFAPAADG